MAKKKKSLGAGSVIRVLSGLIILFLSISGIRGVWVMDKTQPGSVFISIFTAIICIVFVFLGITLLFTAFPGSRKHKPKKHSRQRR